MRLKILATPKVDNKDLRQALHSINTRRRISLDLKRQLIRNAEWVVRMKENGMQNSQIIQLLKGGLTTLNA